MRYPDRQMNYFGRDVADRSMGRYTMASM
jgi:hypothetical protein